MHKANRTYESYWWQLQAMKRTGIANADDVTVVRVARWVEERIDEGVDPGTVNVGLCALFAALKMLVITERFPEDRLRAIRRLRIKRRQPKRLRARHLDVDAFLRLVRMASERDPRLVLPLEIAAFTGMRAGELARIHVDHLRLDAMNPIVDACGYLDVLDLSAEWGEAGTIKNGAARTVPLCYEIRELLKEASRLARERHGGWLLPRQQSTWGWTPRIPFIAVKTLSHQLRTLVKGTEFAGTTWHTLRHTRASWWAQADVSLAKIAFFLGNTVEIVERYYAALKPGYDPECERRPVAMATPVVPTQFVVGTG